MLKMFRSRLRQMLATQSRSSRRRKIVSSRPAEALEDRCLLAANLNLLGSGLLIYGASGVANDLDISQSGTEFTFSDPAEPINATGGLTGFDTNPDPNIVTFDTGTPGFPAFTQIVVNGNAGDDTTTVSSAIDQGLDIRDAPGDGADTVHLLGDIGAPGTGVTSTVILRGETLNLGAGIWTDGHKISVVNDATLTGAVNLDSGAGTVEFQGTIDGAFPLIVHDSGTTRIDGDVGTGTPLADVDISSTGRIHLGGPVTSSMGIHLATSTDVQVSSNLTADGDIVIGTPVTRFTNPAPVTLTSLNGSIDVTGEINSTTVENIHFEAASVGASVHIGGDTSNPGAVSVTSPTVLLDGVIGAEAVHISASISVTAVGGFQASAGDVIVTTPLLTLGPGTNLVSASGAIHVTGDIDGGGGDLLFRRAMTLTIDGSVTGVALFDAQHGAGLLFDDVTIGGSVTADEIIIEADYSTIHLGGNLTSAGDITLIGNTVFTGAAGATLMLTSGGAAGDDIIIRGAVDAGAADQSLVINAAAGAIQNLGTLPNVGIGQTTAFQNVTLTGGILVLNAIEITDGDIIIEGGAVRLNGDLSTTTLDLADVIFRPRLAGGILEIYNRAVPPPSPNMAISGLELSRIQPGFNYVIFGGIDTSEVRLLAHYTTGPFVTPDANVTRFEAALINIGDHIDQVMNEVQFVGDEINFTRSLRGSGDVRVRDFDAVGSVTVNGAMSFPFGLPVPPMDVFFEMPGSDLLVTGNFGHHVGDLTVEAATAMFPAVTAIDVTGEVSITTDTLFVNGGVFSVTGDINVDGDLNLSGHVTLKVPAGKNFIVTGDVIGNGNNLVIRGSGGAINLIDVQGDIMGVGALRIDSSGAATATKVDLEGVNAASIIVRGVDVDLTGIMEATAGNIFVGGAVTLSGDSEFLATSGSRSVRVEGTLMGNGHDLDIKTTSLSLVGAVTDIVNLDIMSSGYNYVTAPITISGDLSWDNGGTKLLVLKDITAGSLFFDVAPRLLAGATLTP